MPQMFFKVKWPDEKLESCYSPSSVISSYLDIGQTYSLKKFMELAEAALNEASERVNAKYGYHCSSAMDQLHTLKLREKEYGNLDNPEIIVINITNKLEK